MQRYEKYMRKYEIFMLNSIFFTLISSQNSEFRPIYGNFAPKMLKFIFSENSIKKIKSFLQPLQKKFFSRAFFTETLVIFALFWYDIYCL